MNKKMSYGLIAVSTLLASLPATLASANDENLKTTKDIQPVSTNTEKHAEKNETKKSHLTTLNSFLFIILTVLIVELMHFIVILI
ncbi:hypothetical protein BFR40_07705 [Brochothrix thermosphacta]|uniref:hypothetical protein n=1 Tax=Brochothrix thermosphacta TaxID=2756 RepID=UPI00083F6681|nr:hypothetical protein [Brochothrix thermosphacta]ODJ50953.1 hypothetical protein BFR40_07705 [Brochothrix thermosphacta]